MRSVILILVVTLALACPSWARVAAEGDSIRLKVAIANAVSKILDRDRENRVLEARGRGDAANYVINLDLEKWIEERGEASEKILSAEDFNRISSKLRVFNQRPDTVRFYVILVNDHVVKFTSRLDPSITQGTFKWNDLAGYPEQQAQVSKIWGETSALIHGIREQLAAAAIPQRILYFYSELKVEEYDDKPKLYKFDRLDFFGAKVEGAESFIRQHVTIPSGVAVTNVDMAVSSIINSTEAVLDKGYQPPANNLENSAYAADHTLPGNSLKSIPEAELKAFARLVDDAYGKRSIGWNDTKSSEDYKYINVVDALKLNVRNGDRNFDIEVLEDKLRNLEEKTGITFYVIAGPLWYALDAANAQAFAREIFNRTTLKKHSKAILITLPYFNTTAVNKASSASKPIVDVSVIHPGIYSHGVDLDLTQVTTTVQNDGYQFVLNAYKFLAKPYSCHIYSIGLNERIGYLTGKSQAMVKGMEAIEELVILRDRNIDRLSQYDVKALPNLEDYRLVVTDEVKVTRYGYRVEDYEKDLNNYYKYFTFYTSALENPDWEILPESRRLKEPFMERSHKQFAAQFFDTSSPFMRRLQSNWGMGAMGDVTYSFPVVRNYVKPVLDAMWFVPVIPNVVGVIWANAEGDYVVADEYAASATIELALTALPVGEAIGIVVGKLAGSTMLRSAGKKLVSLVGVKASSQLIAAKTLGTVAKLGLTEFEEAETRNLLANEAMALVMAKAESQQLLKTFTRKEVFLAHLAFVAERTGIKDVSAFFKVIRHVTVHGIDQYHVFTSKRLLPGLLARDRAYSITSVIAKAPAYAMCCVSYCLKTARPLLTFQDFDTWAVSRSVETSIDLSVRRAIYDEIQNEIIDGVKKTIADDNLVIELLERVEEPKWLNTIVGKLRDGNDVALLWDGLAKYTTDKEKLYNVIGRLASEDVAAFKKVLASNETLAKAFTENPHLVDSWRILEGTGASFKGDVAAIKKIDFLKTSGLMEGQLRNIAGIDDIRAVEIAEDFNLYSQALNGDMDVILGKVFSASKRPEMAEWKIDHGIDTDLVVQFGELARSGRLDLREAEATSKFIRNKLTSAFDNPGFVAQFAQAMIELRRKCVIRIEGGADILNFTESTAFQMKGVTSESLRTLKGNLAAAADQFNSEIPPANFTKILRLDVFNSSNEMFSMKRKDLLSFLNDYYYQNRGNIVGSNIRKLDELRIVRGGDVFRCKVENGVFVEIIEKK